MQRNYGLKFDISRPGFRSGLGTPRVLPITNSANTQVDRWTINIPDTGAISGDTEYAITVDSVTASLTTPATAPTQEEFQLLLIDAIQQSGVFDLASAVVSGTAEVILTARSLTEALSVSGTNLGVLNTVPFAKSSPIPFGLFVVRGAADDYNEGRLPTGATDRLIGVSYCTYFSERDAIGEDAKTAYKPDEVMDILDRVNDCEAIWVSCVEADLTPADTLYVSYSAGNEGKVTRSNVDSIVIPAYAYSVIGSTVINSDGSRMIKISLNMP